MPILLTVSSTSVSIFPQILWGNEFLMKELLSRRGIVHMCVKVLPLKPGVVVRKCFKVVGRNDLI